jgi:hypothetical protein
MKKHLLVSGVLAIWMACVAAVAIAQDAAPVKDELKTVTVTGAGMTAEAALRDAQRKALEEGAGTFIFSQTKVENFQLAKDTVLSRTSGWLQSCDKLSERELEDHSWEVKIKAVVSVKGIVDTWGVVKNLLVQVGRPKIMVWVNEKMENDKGRDEAVPDSTVSAGIEESLLKAGFLLVDRERIKKLAEKEGGIATLEDKPDKIIALMKQEGAQIFITGTSNATKGDTHTSGDMTLYTYEAECNLRGFLEDTGQLIFKVPGKSTRGVQRVWRSAAKQALDFQAQQIAPQVTQEILQHWQDWLGGHGELKMEVEGISFKGYLKLKENLKKVKEIKDVTVQFNNKIANCSIQAEAKAEAVAEAIVNVMNDIEVTDVSANTIKAKYKGTD